MLEDKMIYILQLKFHSLMLFFDEKLMFNIQNEKLKLRFLKELKLVRKYVFDENDFEKNDYSTKDEI